MTGYLRVIGLSALVLIFSAGGAFALDGVQVQSVGAKKIKESGNYAYMSWKVVLKADYAQDVYVKVQFLDAEGYEVSFDNERLGITKGSNTVTGVDMIEKGLARSIKSIKATVD